MPTDHDTVPDGGNDTEDDRRRLERIAYGPSSTPEQRAEALASLDAVTASRESAPSAPSHDLGSSAADDPDDDPAGAEATADQAAGFESEEGAGALERRPSGRRRLWAVSAIAVIVAAVIVVPQLVASSDSSVDLAAAQTEEDRAVPYWLSNAFGFAEQKTGDGFLEERLLDSTRLLNGVDGLDAFAFVDDETSTYCLAAAEAIGCASAEVFARDGIDFRVVDPASTDGTGGIHYTWTEDGGYVVDRAVLSGRASVRIMGSGEWPGLIEKCMQDRGFTVDADSNGGIVAQEVEESSRFELAMTQYHCRLRFPLNATYFSFEG